MKHNTNKGDSEKQWNETYEPPRKAKTPTPKHGYCSGSIVQ